MEIATPDHVMDRPDELNHYGPQLLHALRIRVPEPHISIDLSADRVHLYTGSDEAPSQEAVEKVRLILARRKRRLVNIYQGSWGKALSGALIGLAVSAGIYGVASRRSEWIIGAAAVAVASIWLLIGQLRWRTSANMIILTHRGKTPMFIKLHRDQLVIGVLLAEVVGIIALLARALSDR